MALALKLAALGGRAVAPNPMVGAVIVKNGKIIGRGYHQKFGGPHAEVNAIGSVKHKADLVGATMYVTLEPCRHFGKTPPCLDLVKSVGITRIVCGSHDPFGVRGAGCEVRKPKESSRTTHYAPRTIFLAGRIAEQCKSLNKFFFTWIAKKRPYITVKIATSADGFVAGLKGQEVHFTSPAQDKFVHQLRAQHQAIMVGSSTVLTDDPLLNVRHVKGVDPLRIILDGGRRVPKTAQVFKDKNFLHVNTPTPLKTLFRQLAKDGIASVLVESGPTLFGELKKTGLIDNLIILKGRKKLHQGLSIII